MIYENEHAINIILITCSFLQENDINERTISFDRFIQIENIIILIYN